VGARAKIRHGWARKSSEFKIDSMMGSPFLVMQRPTAVSQLTTPPFTAAGWVLDLTPDQRPQMWTKASKRLQGSTASTGAPSDWTSWTRLKRQWSRRGFGLVSPDLRTGSQWWTEPTIEAALNWLKVRLHPNKTARTGSALC